MGELTKTLFDVALPDSKTARGKPHAMPYGEVRTMEPLSRNHDPLPSYQAADGLKQTGIGGRQRFAVYQALRKNQGVTSAELSRIMDCDRYTPSRRLPELARAGWICRGSRRRCRVSHIACETWWIVRPWAESRKSGSLVPTRRDSERAVAQTLAGERDPITTPDERRQLRRGLAERGDSTTQHFLASVDEQRIADKPAIRAGPVVVASG